MAIAPEATHIITVKINTYRARSKVILAGSAVAAFIKRYTPQTIMNPGI
jgi:hypothetical protein